LNSNSTIAANLLLVFAVICFATFVRGGEQDGRQGSHSDSYVTCIDDAGGGHVEMIACIEEEIDKKNNEIHIKLAAAKGVESIRPLWVALKKSQDSWGGYIKLKCEPYKELGGQRGALLERNCMLEEVLFRSAFVRALLVEAEM